MMTKLMDKETFFKALEAARQPQHGGGHPFSRAFANGELTKGELGFWATQHFYYIDPIPQQFAHLFCRLPDLDARQHLLENLLGEEMPETPEKRHPDLLVKFARACGLKESDVRDAEQLGNVTAGARAMRAWIWELVAFRNLAEACAGIMVALEGQLPTLYPKYVEALRKIGMTDDDLEFFIVHIEGDEEHADIGLELTHRYATTPELQRQAIAAVKASVSVRWQLLDSVYSAIKEKQAA
ncbi:MAG: iron-containing redox enzyme family protein [Rhodospirillales bacterium]